MFPKSGLSKSENAHFNKIVQISSQSLTRCAWGLLRGECTKKNAQPTLCGSTSPRLPALGPAHALLLPVSEHPARRGQEQCVGKCWRKGVLGDTARGQTQSALCKAHSLCSLGGQRTPKALSFVNVTTHV
ncbi:hypothetical protein HJG60_011672 [Phyllostomus discolor]|uniref:Uncharacterized protein n=1 Tax=Phyllostomus discolor TaxID=89673 RepID=A0A834E0Z7_9CHIR|nr:hypothetical protein HJG60_011672 [Phyllostomus discolor]